MRAVVESLEVCMRKSFGGKFGRFVGVVCQTVDQVCVESSTFDKTCGAAKSDSTTPTLTHTASSDSKTSGAQVAKAAKSSKCTSIVYQ